jgi:hypothetical protein
VVPERAARSSHAAPGREMRQRRGGKGQMMSRLHAASCSHAVRSGARPPEGAAAAASASALRPTCTKTCDVG